MAYIDKTRRRAHFPADSLLVPCPFQNRCVHAGLAKNFSHSGTISLLLSLTREMAIIES